MRPNRLVIGCSIVISVAAVSWSAQEYKIEPAWSHVEFAVKNLAIHTVEGRFKTFAGSIAYDEADITKSSVNVTIQAASIDTGIRKRDEHLRTADFFDANKFPEITFRSDRIAKSPNGYVLTGTLTMKGQTKEVNLPFTFSVDQSKEGKKDILHAQASGVINRHDYGIDYGGNFSVGKDVKIVIHIQAVH